MGYPVPAYAVVPGVSDEMGPMTPELLDTTFRNVLDSISDGVYVTTAEREIVYWSAGAERITGYRADEVVGKHCFDNILVHTGLDGQRLCLGRCPLEDSIEHGVGHLVSEVFLKRKDGERLAVYVKTATFESAGRTLGVEVFGELREIAGEELIARVQELSDSSITDPLSGLFNRRYFDAVLEQSHAMFERLGRRYGVLYLDLDHFKSINDTFGHAAGDEAIRFVADVLSSNARGMDVTARYGGDEFTVICPVATCEELESYGLRLVRLVHESLLTPTGEAELALTASAGGSLVDTADQDAYAALRRADAAMYDAKHAGRDRMVVRLAE
jgi:diguanylate cyclase (GGDEF)-like protein/PAS domain S-box-containing protein